MAPRAQTQARLELPREPIGLVIYPVVSVRSVLSSSRPPKGPRSRGSRQFTQSNLRSLRSLCGQPSRPRPPLLSTAGPVGTGGRGPAAERGRGGAPRTQTPAAAGTGMHPAAASQRQSFPSRRCRHVRAAFPWKTGKRGLGEEKNNPKI